MTLLSNFCYEGYARQEGLDFVALDDEESFNTLNNIPELHTKLPLLLKLFKDHIVVNLEKELKLIESKVTGPNTVLFAHSNDYLAPLFAMEKSGVRLYLCVLAPSFVHSFSLFEALLVSLSAEVNEIRGKVGLELVQNWNEWLNGFKQCFAFWPEWFPGGANSVVKDLRYVGFLPIDSIEEKPLQKEIKDFIDERAKTILVTHGTSRPFRDNYFTLAIDVCQKLGHRLIVSTPFRHLLPEVLPENVIWADFCPFHELLPLVDLIVHHGGIGTARESIAHAVPQLIIGQGFDRQHNGRAIKELGLGDWVIPKALSEEALRRKVVDLLNDDGVIKMKCERFKVSISNQSALDALYETVISKTSQDKDGRKGSRIGAGGEEDHSCRASLSTHSSGGTTATASASTAMEAGRSMLSQKAASLNKNDLLLKMLKNRVKIAQSNADEVEPEKGC